MTLLETISGESESDFRLAADAMLQSVSPNSPRWWTPYEVKGTYQYRDVCFRQFSCIAGSVECWIYQIASKTHQRRVIMTTGETMWVARVSMVGRGVEIPVDERELKSVS